MSEAYVAYRAYLDATTELEIEYQEEGTFHIDVCNCELCQAIEYWQNLPTLKRWWAKLQWLWVRARLMD